MPRAAAPPDYADPACWFVPPGSVGLPGVPPDPGPVFADLFYIHPTTLISDSWNQPGPDQAADAWTWQSAILPQAGLCAAFTRLFIPRYRQATSRAYREPGRGAEAAYDLAYADIEAAFAHYLRHHHDGGRFILFGHSQGALHATRLLADIIEPEDLLPKLVAAYAIGIGISQGLFGTRFRRARPCTHPTQTGCVIGWNSFLSGADPADFLQRTAARDAAWLGGAPAGPPICINPLSLRTGLPEADGVASRDGALWISAARAGDLQPLPNGSLHMHDIALFEAELRADAARRCRSAARA
jgi:pimeloyl-ACP methyl ester carboxylesterase